MQPASNFFLSYRLNTSSFLEWGGDILLTPARMLFNGKKALALGTSVHTIDQLPDSPILRTVGQIMGLITLPLSIAGAVIKLPCLKDKNYRDFCMQEFPRSSNPKMFEVFQHVTQTWLFVSENWGDLFFAPLNLSECSCLGTGAFHRLRNPRRNRLENAIVQRLSAMHPNKDQCVYLLSMGSGGLMSDFLTLEKLILAGFKKIVIDCVDTAKIDPQRVKSIRGFFNECRDISVEINAHQSIDSISKRRSYSAVLAVDFDVLGSASKESFSGLADLMKARQRLSENGFLALGFGEDDTLSGINMETIVLTSHSLIEKFRSDLTKQIQSKEELRVFISSFELGYLFIYALALATSKKTHASISISSFSQEDNKNLSEFKAMSRVLFPGMQVAVCIHDKDKKYDILLTGSQEEEFKNEEYRKLLDKEALTYIVYPEAIYRQNSNQENKRTLLK